VIKTFAAGAEDATLKTTARMSAFSVMVYTSLLESRNDENQLHAL
jgi:hypothetical protein